ncbi:MAG: bifunctional precorrin-2 dehydrogenase/sirohydrochlorin ferrochelatase [Nitrosopumilaceae archaeon]|uniref:Bifunctional precorrin-2 dehydrogenase/sirohydrochlorin ferrochelatase n=3 Tax=Candidatus Nitrosomaritimum aestuariumsis TaxID=3342354 RepID=A0AC60W472_9ARCH|nr:bifunctional precorrin-2 dehydrogenase/sirohydrochlorin ferrochelatase [Nitrosopumilaceae archaeon]MBA4454391.1 bifunctional precorrin-2 dehydrogenase/sirohydrochlorin ferrochelatase [Nitrosopumilaceae archaeon]MBA4460400.1 bifunctional precorrin-2 dehydrogenase/sirohydrochlorin ferrochelatase [Nitrosopumilaceae archaeon]MBA4461620.1 bifunctional precorrin-2 dehydrogenase/sirohydrochlorin ferrochelatase [Nitrosopumilaceae archaeon]MBA4464122.1 bifunctional precorrin-2 dehydrogenase/sirohydro
MIVNLNLQNKKVVVVGGGKESLKRINSLLNQKCQITVISEKVSKSIENLSKKKLIKLKKQRIENIDFLTTEKPHLVITTTNDEKLNQKIINKAKKNKIIAYSSDSPETSDFSNPAIVDFEKIIQIAIFTGGKSPIMSKKIKGQIEKILEKTITKEDIAQIKIQQIARNLIKDKIDSQARRKSFLNSIISDKKIKQLIKDGQTKKVENHIIAMLRNWV